MKIRTAFVSNSSSSSFIAIVPMEVHERVLEKVHPYVKAVVEQFGHAREENVLGVPCRVVEYMSVMDYSPWDDIYIDYDWDYDELSEEEQEVLDEGMVPLKYTWTSYDGSKEYTGYIDHAEGVFDKIYLKEAQKEGDIFIGGTYS